MCSDNNDHGGSSAEKHVRRVGQLKFVYDEEDGRWHCPQCQWSTEEYANSKRHVNRDHPQYAYKESKGPERAREAGGARHREVVSEINRTGVSAGDMAAQVSLLYTDMAFVTRGLLVPNVALQCVQRGRTCLFSAHITACRR